MIQSSMLATFPEMPPEKLPAVVAALNAQAGKLTANQKISVTFMLAKQEGIPLIRAQIVAQDFSGAEKMSDKIEELLTKLGGTVGERAMAGEVW